MWKQALLLTAMIGGFVLVGASEANAARWRRGVVYHRPVAPVHRVVRRAAWAAHPAVGPVLVRPVVHPYAYPVYTYPHYPAYYGPGVSVQIGF
jgi:hypothetical protein